jgi:hypothetical protein
VSHTCSAKLVTADTPRPFIISKLDENEKTQQNQPVKVDTPAMTYFERSNFCETEFISYLYNPQTILINKIIFQNMHFCRPHFISKQGWKKYIIQWTKSRNYCRTRSPRGGIKTLACEVVAGPCLRVGIYMTSNVAGLKGSIVFLH